MRNIPAMSSGHDDLVNPRISPSLVVQLLDYEDGDDDVSIPNDVILYNSMIGCLC
jgi:hypothetical protein